MPAKIIMPQGGQDLTTGKIIRWIKNEGDQVKQGQVICEVETEKAVFEVTAPQDGYLIKILAREDEEVKILSTIAYVGDKNELLPEYGNLSDEEIHTDTFEISIIGNKGTKPEKKPKIKISPKARHLAKQYGFKLEELKSSRSDGKITCQDVQDVVDHARKTKDMSTLTPDNANMMTPDKLRRVTAHRMVQSWTQAPHFFISLHVDMSSALEFRLSQKEENISITDLIICACAIGLRKFPQVNASYIDDETILRWNEINIGLAVAVDNGLIMAVLENVDHLSLDDVSKKRRHLIEQIKTGKQPPSKPSHFTISNLGMFNVNQFTAILNPPEAAILAVSSILPQPIATANRQIEVKDMMNITLSFDHRVGDGMLAAEFLNEVRRLLENPNEIG